MPSLMRMGAIEKRERPYPPCYWHRSLSRQTHKGNSWLLELWFPALRSSPLLKSVDCYQCSCLPPTLDHGQAAFLFPAAQTMAKPGMQKVTPASFPDRMLGAEKDGRDNVDSEPEAPRHPDPITVWAFLLTHKP